MARSGARSTGLALVLLLAGAWVALNAVSFVAPRSDSSDSRSVRTAMQAELMKKDVKTDLTAFRSSVATKLKKGTGPFEYSTGARNEVSLITPEVDTKSIQSYLSIAPVFITVIIVFTAGGLIEFQRFFPDTMYW
eukprot:CAMPEP_0115258680 /NCGR_PEP_ID=MMETSP0270-20121206/47424_1 /TAXON_ID=71861 /ORGANISM="Scrippsiella trochoidea, Strain CCMP3099" /LENGTH=134 /DNA_ID=CAMNT_0002674447 /DNA_START=85 /DNA_END=489 /DNA_ORIENTATION=+